MDRRRLVKLAAAASLFPGGIAGFIRAALAAGVNPAHQGLQKVLGQVTVNGRAARTGMLIQAGDAVATGADSEAVYVIGQDAFLQRENTTVQFLGDAAEDFFRIATGKLLSVFGKGRKTLRVPTATIGIRGTACYIEAAAEKTYFCLCYGEAEVTPTAAPQQAETIRTFHHDHPIYIHGDPAMATRMVGAEVINHSDAELVMLENLVGRWPPFQGKVGAGYSGRYTK